MIMRERPKYYIGIDTHKFTHTACVMNYDTDSLLSLTFENAPSEYEEALNKILDVTKTDSIIFGLEDVNSCGLLFSRYLDEKGYIVKYVNPTLPSTIRKNSSNYRKTDEYDAYCVARVLKDDYKRLPNFRYEQVFTNIRTLANRRNLLTEQKGTNYQQLHQQIMKLYPEYTKFFSELQTRCALTFYRRFPSSRFLEGYNCETLVKEMKGLTRIFTEAMATRILSANVITYVDEIVENIIIDLIDDIYDKEEKIKKLEKQLEVLIKKTGYQLETIPGVSTAIASNLISVIGNIERFKSEKQLANFCGVAPVTIGSGGKSIEQSSKGGHRELRSTFYNMALGMISVNKNGNARYPMYRGYYLKKLQEGKSGTQAMVCIMRQLVRLVHSMMKNKTEWKTPVHEEKVQSIEI